jgi:hypothetical protein
VPQADAGDLLEAHGQARRGSGGLRCATSFRPREKGPSPLDPVDPDSPLGQPGADFPPGLGLPLLPGVHALLGYHELCEVIPGGRLDQTREIGAGAPQLEQERLRGQADRRRGGRQGTVVRDAAACRRGCLGAGVNDGRSLSWVVAPVNPHLVLTGIGAPHHRRRGRPREMVTLGARGRCGRGAVGSVRLPIIINQEIGSWPV